ncbi:Asp-tRNA(Asn)/Glu-tRNA(Gln) amidotransferase subunit GatB [Suttonella ornithocola]|uniref:Aspartyl/glutamyl-tRNA(Asn/Gln) amidotransferase subunit B n=1 Tax=Suttonella ornithocola TaxID=279832 RepID=A0A380N0L8_9GAMM|nr:Asp-tRNA(Asn)/Glu-tRNA(Gln) amidotransferase subunit GatB [Suttonella ornithocola]SUO97297.1 Aspartyl/glutamyl-tRNA(Asn/Gln) amidotransferase subunit B [Suttonella ornithocola]
MSYEAVIGLELHIQLSTQSKLFSSSPTKFGAAPNTQVNEIDLGYPGVLPVLNKQAVKYAILFGLALNSEINQSAIFMRKNYFYPDLPKGYQISQLEKAIILGGNIYLEAFNREVRINRGQLEEDAGKSVHDAFSDRTGVDLNRAGVPLIELVSEPDMRSAEEAVAYMRKIHHLVRYLGISDGNMQEGSFRCDANVSIRKVGTDVLNERVELKNINSFRFVEQAINIEIERQIAVLEAGETVVQETRLFDPDKLETRTMRTKEDANDYRYFPDPDLLTLSVDDDMIKMLTEELPELPEQRKERYSKDYHLSEETIQFLIQDRFTGNFFDSINHKVQDAKICVNWMQNDLAKLLNEGNLSFSENKISDIQFAELLGKIKENIISAADAKKVLIELWNNSSLSVDDIIEQKGYKQVNDDSQIEIWVDEVLASCVEQVSAYQNGQVKMLGFLVGQVLKKSQGKANPKVVNQMLVNKLS